MKTFVIRQRVADFLKQHTPFDALAQEDLLQLAGSGKVKFHESDEYVFRQGDPKQQFVWVIQQGRVELLEESDSSERLHDVMGEGDILGLDQFVGDGAYRYSARTATDVIVYGVAAAQFESLLLSCEAVKRFLAARSSVSGVLGFNRTSWLDAAPPPMGFLRTRRTSGIPDSPAIPAPFATRTAVLQMLQSRTEQVLITRDDALNSPVEAVLTASDLAMFCDRNLPYLVRSIREAESAEEIGPLLKQANRWVSDALAQPRDIEDCCRISREVVAAVSDASIRHAGREVRAAGIAAPDVPYCLAMFGKLARGDEPGTGLPAIAAVYDDAGGEPARKYFGALASAIASKIDACATSGPAVKWPEGAQASMPLTQWKRLYSDAIRDPIGNNVYARREFFDVRLVSGDGAILQDLQEHIDAELLDHEMAIALLANDTLIHVPPLTFFRGLVMELDGAQRESFDIGETVVGPLADAARVFALAARRLTPAGTLDRLSLAETDFPEGAATIREAADAFRIGLYYQNLARGTRMVPGRLGKFDQALLKTAFSSITRFLEFTLSIFLQAV